ncbi:Protein SHQ1 [Phytophthora citrophthora]|uniref:Protein SHQ1 n=1 Tax=Phytophthora citrophthora TaxID=4793 RepID=A0AAD9LRR1_9STRA|nr:Protein SHQ1 [Phytophthora citrophthora]
MWSMVATPKFHVTQDAAWVFVHVHVPFVRVSEMEFYVDGVDFTFYCKPYLLKLHFPHAVVDDELAKAVYDPNKDNGTIVVHLPKKEPGQDFPDLDMLTKLLQPQRPPVDMKNDNKRKTPLIEVLESSTEPIGTFQEENDRLNALIDGNPMSSECNVPPAQVQTDSSLLGLETPATMENVGSIKLDGGREGTAKSIGVRVTELAPTYGFNNAYSDFFRVWHGEVTEILSLPDPEHIQPEQRRILREAAEEQMFDVERYLMDFANQGDDMYYDLAMAYEPFWRKYPVLSATQIAPEVKKEATPLIVEVESDINRVGEKINHLSLEGIAQPTPAPPSVAFTDAEQELLLRLPRKEFLIPEGSSEEKLVIGGLVDILIGFAYEQLTTQGDSGVESTWTVSIVSPTLSWLDSNADLRAVVRSTVRRMITFPFLRQYDLALQCVREANEILKRGKRVLLRALLTLYRIVEKSETQYLLNSLYIQDYCVWIQSVSDKRLQTVGAELEAHIAAFTKSETGWALEELERSLFEVDEVEHNESLSSESDSSDSDESSSEEESSDDSSDEEDDKEMETVKA